MSQPNIFLIKASQVGSTDINMFIYSALSKEFGNNFEIVNESTHDRMVPGFKGLRKIKAYGIQANGASHSLYFDITEVSTANTSSQNWLGNH